MLKLFVIAQFTSDDERSATNVFCESQFVSIKAQGDKEYEFHGFTYKPGYQAVKDEDSD